MSLVEAFRFPFYRIFFSVVVGIIAFEGLILSHNYNEDRKLTDGVLIRIVEPNSPQELPLPGQIEIPFTVKKFKKSKNQSTEFNIRFSRLTKSVAPKIKFTGGFVIKRDPILVLENRPDIIIGNHWVFLKFKSWNVIVLTIYLLIAGIVGEFLCTLGDLLVGMCFFGFNPYSCDNDLEYCRPDYIKDKIKALKKNNNTDNNNQKKGSNEEAETPNQSDKSNDTKGNNSKIVKISSILRNNPMITDFSELHFSLSRVYAGLFLTILVIGTVLSIRTAMLNVCVIATLVVCLIIFTYLYSLLCHFSLLCCLLTILIVSVPPILAIFYKPDRNVLITAQMLCYSLYYFSFIFLSLSIIFRTQANRIIKAQGEQQTQTEIRS